MKFAILLFGALLLPAAVIADEETAKTEVSRLKGERADKLGKALETLNGQYKTALQDLLKSVMQSGDLDGAVLVRKEVNLLDDPAYAIATALPDPAPPGSPKTAAMTRAGSLRSIRNNRAAELFAPISREYKNQLETLLKSNTLAGDLDAALYLKKELKAADVFTARSPFAGTRWYNARADGGPCTLIFAADGTFSQLYHNHRRNGRWTDNPDGSCSIAMPNSPRSTVRISAEDRNLLTRSDKQQWRREPEGSPPHQVVDETEDDKPKVAVAPAKKKPGEVSGKTGKEAKPASADTSPGKAADSPDTLFGKRTSAE